MRVSIFIRASNSLQHCQECLRLIQLQRNPGPRPEVLIFGTTLSQDLVNFLKPLPVDLYTTYGYEPSHAALINFALRQASNDLVVLLDESSIPANEEWLVELVRPFANTSVVATFAREIAAPEASLLEVKLLEGNALDSDLTLGIESSASLRGHKNLASITRSGGCVCVRRSFANSIGIRQIPDGEFHAFALDGISASQRVSFVSTALFYRAALPALARTFYKARNLARARKTITRQNVLPDDAVANEHNVREFLLSVFRFFGFFGWACVSTVRALFRPNTFREIKMTWTLLGAVLGELDVNVASLFSYPPPYPPRAEIQQLLAKVQRIQ